MDGDGTNLSYNLRFPGQYYDAETDKHYNFNRDYDPRTGRYIQFDPIGLDGGMNSFGYVSGNPLIGFDVRGECGFLCPLIPAVGEALGWGAGVAVIGNGVNNAIKNSTSTNSVIRSNSTSTGNSCSKLRHRFLQDDVNFYCKPNPGNCKIGDTCEIMVSKLVSHDLCAQSRKRINNECFNGGDRGHQIEYTNRRIQAEMCNGMLPSCK